MSTFNLRSCALLWFPLAASFCWLLGEVEESRAGLVVERHWAGRTPRPGQPRGPLALGSNSREDGITVRGSVPAYGVSFKISGEDFPQSGGPAWREAFDVGYWSNSRAQKAEKPEGLKCRHLTSTGSNDPDHAAGQQSWKPLKIVSFVIIKSLSDQELDYLIVRVFHLDFIKCTKARVLWSWWNRRYIICFGCLVVS